MLINAKAGWLIITPPKTASTTLSKHFAQFYTGAQHDSVVPPGFNGRVYLTSRNPFDRAVSLWMHHLWDLARPRDGRPDHAAPERTFDEFLEIRPALGPFFDTASSWVRHIPLCRTLRVENLENALRREGMLAADEVLPQHNRTRHDPWWTYYCRDSAAIVMKDFAEDFERFGYKQTWVCPDRPDGPGNGC